MSSKNVLEISEHFHLHSCEPAAVEAALVTLRQAQLENLQSAGRFRESPYRN